MLCLLALMTLAGCGESSAKTVTSNGVECYRVDGVCYPAVFGEPQLTGEEITALQEGSDIGNAVAIMYTTAYCGDPPMPAVWLRDSADGHQSTIHLSDAEKDTQQILLLRDGYTFTF